MAITTIKSHRKRNYQRNKNIDFGGPLNSYSFLFTTICLSFLCRIEYCEYCVHCSRIMDRMGNYKTRKEKKRDVPAAIKRIPIGHGIFAGCFLWLYQRVHEISIRIKVFQFLFHFFDRVSWKVLLETWRISNNLIRQFFSDKLLG